MALAWCATEFIRCELMPLRFPWMSAGLALEPWPLVSWIGVYGLGLVMVFAVAATLLAGWRAFWTIPFLSLVWFMGPLGTMKERKGFGALPVAIIQAESAPLSRYLELSEITSGSTKLIVWPEYAVPKDVRSSSDLATIQAFAAKRNAIIVFGTQTSLGGSKWQNTALTVDGTRVLGEHGKHHTVHLFDDGESGTTMKAIDTPLGRMGTPVCFDCDFQDVVRHMTLDGAEFFAVPSMDAAHWGEKQHIQHAQLFRLRAAENRRPFVVAASSGVSQIINANGWSSLRLPPMVEDMLNGRLTPEKELTFFTRWGWLTPWAALGAVFIWLFGMRWAGSAPLR
jgi:apolipoprotein N-acyltransferase